REVFVHDGIGNHRDLVEVLAQELALALELADHGEGYATNADRAAEPARVAEHRLARVPAQHHDVGAALHFLFGEEPAALEILAVHHQIVLVGAEHERDLALLAAVLETQIVERELERRDRAHRRTAVHDRGGVVHRERAALLEALGNPARELDAGPDTADV